MTDEYQSRLAMMESWYGDLLALGADEADRLLLSDYAPHARWLEGLSGRVIDIGGGAGLAARFFRTGIDYVVVDPSAVWDSPQWRDFARAFRASGPEPRFVKAGGEALPFADGEYDAALAFWSLNHARDPAACVREIARVLCPGGVARLVIDDVEPGWPDLLSDGAARIWARLARRRYTAKIQKPLVGALRAKLAGDWPIHDDHIRIAEADLRRWIGDGMELSRREWLDGSLSFDLVKHSRRARAQKRTPAPKRK